jgi:hypothetical protein
MVVAVVAAAAALEAKRWIQLSMAPLFHAAC